MSNSVSGTLPFISRDATPSGFPTSEIGTYVFGRLFPREAIASSVYSFAVVIAAAADPAGSKLFGSTCLIL